MTAHSGGRRLYTYIKRSFYFPSISVYCYAIPRNCTTCANNRALLRNHKNTIHLFPAGSPLQFVAIDILGKFNNTPRGNNFLLVITDLFLKLVRIVSLRIVTLVTFARAFVTHLVLTYGPRIWLLSGNRTQSNSRFFQKLLIIR